MLYVECGRYEDAVYYFAMADLSQMTDAEKNGYRKALIASGQKERAGELGLTDMAFRDPVLDGAFERGELGLEETSIGGLEITADNIVFSEEARQALNYADEETFREELEEGFESGQWEIRVASLAPAGNSGILDISGVAAAWYEGQVRPLYPSPDRGVEDAFENLEEYTSRISSHFESFLGNEGAVYSPDGRYAAVFNVRNTLKTANFFQDPILIDLSTGELILTETWPNGLSEEGSGAVTAASFSSDGRYFYYSLYGGFEDSTGVGIARLFRYELETGETELCKGYTYDEKKDRDYWLYYPHLVELSDGSFLQLNDSNRMNDITGVVRTRMEKGEWIIEQADFSLPIFQFYPDRLDYSLNSGYAAITGRSMRMSDLNQNAFGLQIFRPEEAYEGLDRYIFIGKEDGQAVIFTPEEYSSLQKALSEALTEAKESEDEGAVSQWYQELPYQFIMNSVLSPDGQYLLLVTKSIEIDSPAFHLLLLRLEDLSVREVSGVDPVTLESQEIEFLKYMEWNTDQLVFRTMDGFRTFRFRY